MLYMYTYKHTHIYLHVCVCVCMNQVIPPANSRLNSVTTVLHQG